MSDNRARKNNKVNNVIFYVCLVVLIGAVAVGAYQGVKKYQANKAYEALRPEIEAQDDLPEEDDAEKVVIPIDFQTLQSQYPDAYAWIRIPDTPVDYPIMQSADDRGEDYYLDHTIDGEANLPGAIYTQSSKNKRDMSDAVTVIYGHNMRNDSMFGSLNEYKDEEYRSNHPYIFVYTPEHIYKYEIFGAVTYSSNLILSKYDCNNSKEAYGAFLESLTKESYSPTWISEETEVTTEDKIIVLSTCNNNDTQRFLICGVLVEE